MGEFEHSILLIVALGLTYLFASAFWEVITKPEAREEFVSEFKRRPIAGLLSLGFTFSFMAFLLGIAIPIFGNLQVIQGGLEYWQLGGLSALACWLFGTILGKGDKK